MGPLLWEARHFAELSPHQVGDRATLTLGEGCKGLLHFRTHPGLDLVRLASFIGACSGGCEWMRLHSADPVRTSSLSLEVRGYGRGSEPVGGAAWKWGVAGRFLQGYEEPWPSNPRSGWVLVEFWCDPVEQEDAVRAFVDHINEEFARMANSANDRR